MRSYIGDSVDLIGKYWLSDLDLWSSTRIKKSELPREWFLDTSCRLHLHIDSVNSWSKTCLVIITCDALDNLVVGDSSKVVTGKVC